MVPTILEHTNPFSPIAPNNASRNILAITLFVSGILAVLGINLTTSLYVIGGGAFLSAGAYLTRSEKTVEYELINTSQATDHFTTHTSIHAERLHAVSEFILLPARFNAQQLAYTIEPFPGDGKGNCLRATVNKILHLILFFVSLPFAVVSFLLAFPLRCIDNAFRPRISIFNYSQSVGKASRELLLTKEAPLHIRTHNVGFTPTTMSITGDLRDPKIRAEELAYGILKDTKAPDILLFQETFHEEATQILCDSIKEKYPYIVHSIHPGISGFNSGGLIASKYPIESAYFHQLNHNLWPESLSPKGILRVEIKGNQERRLLLYSVHTQALLGEERAKSRFNQIKELHAFMKQDREKFNDAYQIVAGDFNISTVTAWGEDNYNDQAEKGGIDLINATFDDVFLRDHNAKDGKRTKENPRFLAVDNELLKEKQLTEPTGSWFHGPFADPGMLLSWKMRFERWWNDHPIPAQIVPIVKSLWGTPQWHETQLANTARFDYIFLLKEEKRLDGRVEIRRPYTPLSAQSASTDHLPVDGQFWIN